MGDMVFGGGLNTMHNGIENEPILRVLEGGLK